MPIHPRGGRNGSVSENNQRAQLANAYQELGKELTSEKLKVVGGYTLGRVIGEGTYGLVHLATHRLTSTKCAIKKIPKSLTSSLTREIHHHRRLHHPHVCQLLEVMATESSIYLVTELCAGGELFDYLVERGRLPEGEARRIFGELCLAVGYLHKMGIVHRDLKLENVLLDGECHVKLGDLGFAREFEPNKLLETFCGTTGYACPEMLEGRKYVGEEVDVWSLGIILYSLLCGGLPFDDDDEMTMRKIILKGQYEEPEWLSPESRDLIRSCLSLDPTKRPKVKDMLSHKWFSIYIEDPLPPASPSKPIHILPSPISDNSGNGAFYLEPDATLIDPSTPQVDVSPLIPTTPPHSSRFSDESEQASLAASFNFSEGISSGLTTPTTAEECDTEVGVGSRPEVDSDLKIIHRNTSQQTLRMNGGTLKALTPSASSAATLGVPLEEEEFGQVLPERHHTDDYTLHLPLSLNSRTPSRTKRRSMSSTLSERLHPSSTSLTTLHRTAIAEQPPVTDYLALLSHPTPAPFTSRTDKAILSSLSVIGFDVGQLQHSVTHNACDTSGALWWILKARADEQEAYSQDEELRQVGSDVEKPTRGREPKKRASPTKKSKQFVGNPTTISTISTNPAQVILTRKRSRSPGSPDSEVILFKTSQSEPAVPLVSGEVITGLPASKSYPESENRSASFHLETITSSPPDSPGKNKRSEAGKGRSASVSMLASLTAGLVRKKSEENGFRDERDSGQVTPSEKLQKATPPSSRSKSGGHVPAPSPSRRATHPVDIQTSPPHHHSPARPFGSLSDTPSSKPNNVEPSTSKNGIFTTFRMWFKDGDKRSNKGKRKVSIPGTVTSPIPFQQHTLPVSVRGIARSSSRTSHRGGRGSRRASDTRPGMPNYRSNSMSSMHSRRSSVASVRMMGDSHFSPTLEVSSGGANLVRGVSDPLRRRSIGSRTPTSDRDLTRPTSRPSSIRSFNLAPAPYDKYLSRSPSASSAGSLRRSQTIASPLQQYHKRVGSTGSSVKVMRQIRTVHSSHIRSPSAASSIRSVSSRSSSVDVTPLMYRQDSSTFSETEGPSLAALDEGHESGSSVHSAGEHDPERLAPYSSKVMVAHKIRTPRNKRKSRSDIGLGKRTKPVLRDVFANKTLGDDGEWVDEDDDGFQGGLGQSSSKAIFSTQTPVSPSLRQSIFSPSTKSMNPSIAGESSKTMTLDSPPETATLLPGSPVPPVMSFGPTPSSSAASSLTPASASSSTSISSSRRRGATSGPAARKAFTTKTIEEEEETEEEG